MGTGEPTGGERMAFVKAIVLLRASGSGKDGENRVQSPKLHLRKRAIIPLEPFLWEWTRG